MPDDAAHAASATDLASSIAARMIALDPTSTPLHAAAASLLQVGPLTAHGRIDEARGLVRAAAALIVPIAQRAAGPTPTDTAALVGTDSTSDPTLRGAVVDALRGSARLRPEDRTPRASNRNTSAREEDRP
jgi:hypothetical protein